MKKIPIPFRLGHISGRFFKVDSRLRGNDNIDGVIPAKAGIQSQNGAEFSEIF